MSHDISDCRMVVLPHNRDLELVVLGTIIRYNEWHGRVADILTPALFYDSRLCQLYKCVDELVRDGKVTDITSILSYAEERHMEFARAEVVEAVTSCNEQAFRQSVDTLRRYQVQRELWRVWTAAAMRIVEPLADVEGELESVRQVVADMGQVASGDDMATFADSFIELDTIIEDNQQGRHQFLPTGFSLFDRHYLLRPNTLTILAAFTSVGKSALAMNIAVHVAQFGHPVAYYSLEMGKAELAARAVSKPSSMTAGRLMNGRLNNDERAAYASASVSMARLPIYIDERSTVSFDRTLRSIRMAVKKYGVRLAVIDYLQIYCQNGDRVEEGLAAMARATKNVAKECGIAVLLLSQLNRSSDHPSIRMLRGSGQIEESADNVVLIDRPAAYPDGGKYQGEHANEDTRDTALLILAKGRGVGTGEQLVGFDGEHTQFYEINNNNKIW